MDTALYPNRYGLVEIQKGIRSDFQESEPLTAPPA